jgi:hypothetical protein
LSPLRLSATAKSNAATAQDTAVVELFSVPAPDEILHYVNKDEIRYQQRLLNKTANKNLYTTSKDQYISLGIYLADLAYCVSFKQSGHALEYFQLIDEMGKTLNIFPSSIETIKSRFSENLGQIDSLKQMYYEVYEMVMDNLFETSRFNHYTLVSSGAFVESVYLAVNSTQPDKRSNDFKRRLGDQKMVFDQIISMSNKYLDATNKKLLLTDIQSLVEAYDGYSSKSSPPSAHKRYDGAVVISSTKAAEATDQSLLELNTELTKLRMLWTKK